MQSARAAVEVTVGLVPMQPIPELTQRWVITSEEWEEALDKTQSGDNLALPMPVDYVGRLLTDAQGPALSYAQLMMLQPQQYNFVRTDWIWF